MQLSFSGLGFFSCIVRVLGGGHGAYINAENEVWLVDFCVPGVVEVESDGQADIQKHKDRVI